MLHCATLYYNVSAEQEVGRGRCEGKGTGDCLVILWGGGGSNWPPWRFWLTHPLSLRPSHPPAGYGVTEQFSKKISPLSLYMVLEQWYVRHSQ